MASLTIEEAPHHMVLINLDVTGLIDAAYLSGVVAPISEDITPYLTP